MFRVFALLVLPACAFVGAPLPRRASAARGAGAGGDEHVRRPARADAALVRRHAHVSRRAATPSSPAASAGLVVPRAAARPAVRLTRRASPRASATRSRARAGRRDRALVDECIAYLGWRLVHEDAGGAGTVAAAGGGGAGAGERGGDGFGDDDDDGVSGDFIAEGRRLLSVRRSRRARGVRRAGVGRVLGRGTSQECAAGSASRRRGARGAARPRASGALVALPGFSATVALARDELVAGARTSGSTRRSRAAGARARRSRCAASACSGRACPLVRIVANVGEPPSGRATAA